MSTVEGLSALKEIETLDPKEKEIDPYKVFKAHIEAIGGIYNVENDKNFKTTGEIEMNHNFFDFEEYGQKPLKNRLNLLQDDEVVYSSGDNGSWIWVKNGDKLSKFPDASESRPVDIAKENLEYMDPNSKTFSIDSVKKRMIDGRQTYEIKVTNRVNDDEDYYYFDAETFMLNKEKNVYNGKTVEINYSDYRDVAGVLKPFKIETKNLSTNKYEIKIIKEYKRNILMDSTLFDIPDEEETKENTNSFSISYNNK